MTAVQELRPLSTTTSHPTPTSASTSPSTVPKRERNLNNIPQNDNMLQDFHSFTPVSPNIQHSSSFQTSLALSTHHHSSAPSYPYHQQQHNQQHNIQNSAQAHSQHQHQHQNNNINQHQHHHIHQQQNHHHHPHPQQHQQQQQQQRQQQHQEHHQQQQHRLQQQPHIPHQQQHIHTSSNTHHASNQPQHQNNRSEQHSAHQPPHSVQRTTSHPHQSSAEPSRTQSPPSLPPTPSDRQSQPQPHLTSKPHPLAQANTALSQATPSASQPLSQAHLTPQSQPQPTAKLNSQHHQLPLQPSLPQLHHQPLGLQPAQTQHQALLQAPQQQAHQHQQTQQQPHVSQQQSLQPLLQQHHQHQSVLLPAISQAHFKHTDGVDVADDLINLASLPSSRPQDMHAAFVSSTFSNDHLPTGQHSVIDSILPDAEQDPLNMSVNLHMPLHIDPQRAIDRHVLVTSDAEPPTRPPMTSQHAILGATTSAALQNTQPFSLQMPPGMAHLQYGHQANAIPHPQVLMQGSPSVSPFPVQLPPRPVDATAHMVMGRSSARAAGQQQGFLNMTTADEVQRRGLGSNQISIQDLTKPKSEQIETGSQDAHYSPASPSFSAVTISPPAMVQSTQPATIAATLSAGNATGSGGESPTSVAAPQGLSCPICSSVFTRRYNLKVHMSSKHSARRDFHCKDCPNAFNRVDSLKRHVATTHRGEKKWTCEYCRRNFGQRPHMKMHIDTVHLKKRDHKCHCGKAFGTRYNLMAHQRTHEQTPKKHVCLVCKKSFALKSSLARHQRNSAHSNAELQPPPPRVQN